VFTRDGDTLVMARPEHAELAGRLLIDPATVESALAELADAVGGRLVGVVARTGLEIPAPEIEVTLTTAADRRLPDWVRGHFTGPAWVVLSPDGRVLSTAVLKDYDERLREISVGTEEEARGRGLARSVVRAAARGVLAEGRAVLYLHDLGNDASAAVAKAAGLQELARLTSVVGERVRAGPPAS
jgi:RimJ/RimL family protein N-acetyltransferase